MSELNSKSPVLQVILATIDKLIILEHSDVCSLTLLDLWLQAIWSDSEWYEGRHIKEIDDDRLQYILDELMYTGEVEYAMLHISYDSLHDIIQYVATNYSPSLRIIHELNTRGILDDALAKIADLRKVKHYDIPVDYYPCTFFDKRINGVNGISVKISCSGDRALPVPKTGISILVESDPNALRHCRFKKLS